MCDKFPKKVDFCSSKYISDAETGYSGYSGYQGYGGYGNNGKFLRAIDERNLTFMIDVHGKQKFFLKFPIII